MIQHSKVLVIDDDLAVRLRIGDLLARSGDFILHEASNGADGLAAALEVEPDLILLDIMMPGMTGFEVCTALRAAARTREIPIIVLSAAEESEAMIHALESGADDFLRKPFSGPELRAKVRTITRLNRYRALAGERDRFHWLIDRSLEPLIIADHRGALVYANARAREVFDVSGAPGVDVATAISRHFRAEPADAWAAWRELRQPPGEPFGIFQPETAQVAAQWYQVELHALDGAASQTLLKFTNRSGAVRRELETFTFQHLISHKVRTPLNGLGPILAFLSASEEANLDEGTASLLRLAQESADRLEQTLTSVLDYHAAVFAPRQPEQAALRKPLVEVVTGSATIAGLAGRVTLAAPAGEVAQPGVLEVALTEVLGNYAKFSEAPLAGVQAELFRAPERWELRMFAPGPGLPPEVVAQLGRPYAQLEKSFSGEVPGMGLGLATVRVLLRSIGGDIAFANHPDTPGLVTTLHLPPGCFHPSAAPSR